MAATLTLATDGRGAQGDKLVRRGTGNLGIYATNGIAVTKSNFDLPVRLSRLEIDNAGGLVFEVVSLTAAVSKTVTATGAYVSFLGQAHVRYAKRVRLSSSANTNVTYRANLHEIVR